MEKQWNELKIGITDVFNQHFHKLVKIWDEIGLDDAERNSTLGSLRSTMVHRYAKFIEEQAAHRDELLEEINGLGYNFLNLNNDLEANIAEPDENLNIRELRKYLKEKIDILNSEKQSRLENYNNLRKEEVKLANSLCVEPLVIQFKCAPNLSQLKKYKEYVDAQRAELTKRKELRQAVTPVIVNFMNELDYRIQNDFQRDAVFSQDFIFSEENMTQLENFKRDLEGQFQTAKLEVENIRKSLLKLWSFLQINKEEQQTFLGKCTGKQCVVLEMLKKELNRCYECKLENIEKYIRALRLEIKSFWDLMYYTEEDKQSFTQFYSDNYTEALLTVHEKELQMLKDTYEKKKDIFDIFKNRMQLWDRMKALESKANDPSRYNNRGGKLLAEERERTKIMNQFPKLEQKLFEEVSKWEQENAQPFIVFGQSVQDYIKEQWESRELEKENEKLERRAKNQQMMDDMLNGKTAVLGSGKRPRDATPLGRAGTSKFAKTNILTPINTRTNIQISTCGKPPMSSSKVMPPQSVNKRKGKGQPARLLFSKRAAAKKPANPTRETAGDETNPFSISIESTNSEFQRNLRSRLRQDKYCRSSAVPSTPPATPKRYRDRLGLPFLY